MCNALLVSSCRMGLVIGEPRGASCGSIERKEKWFNQLRDRFSRVRSIKGKRAWADQGKRRTITNARLTLLWSNDKIENSFCSILFTKEPHYYKYRNYTQGNEYNVHRNYQINVHHSNINIYLTFWLFPVLTRLNHDITIMDQMF